MPTRQLGQLTTSPLGLGCFSMANPYGHANEAESLATIHRALELGCNFFDTAEAYGPFTNEQLLAKALRGNRHKAVIATKFGYPIGTQNLAADGRSHPSHIQQSVEGSLQRLGTDYIDLYYQHRIDPITPIEDVAAAVAALVKQGKVRHFGLSEAGVANIRRAHAVLPVAALQSEYSLWERNLETDVIPVLRELGIGLVPYCPLGRGFLTGDVKRAEEYPPTDFRRDDPRYQGENFDANMRAVQIVKNIGAAHHATPAQIALAWLLHKGPEVVPIPGTRSRKHLEDNLKSVNITLNAAEMKTLDEALAPHNIAGPRYGEKRMAMIDR